MTQAEQALPATISAENPFIRGYGALRIQRILQITYEDDCPPCHRPLHATQAHLPDADLHCFPCVFNDDFVLITEGQDIEDELSDQCRNHGIVRTVLYSITSEENGMPVFVGDAYSEEQARTIVHRLTFQTGHYSRSWEISTDHLPLTAMQHIRRLSGFGDPVSPTGALVEFFFLADCEGVGCKLISTPWTDQNLESHGLSSAELHQEQLSKGLPTELVDVLHLAAQADVRFLVFDPFAPVLKGLALFSD